MSIDLFNGSRLILAGGGRAWVWLAVGCVALGLLLWLYREERRLVSRGTGLALLSLRVLAAGVLVATLFEPIAAWTHSETIRGRVIIAADLSESMSTIDPDQPDKLPRREQARRLLEGAAAPLAGLNVEHDVTALGFAREGTAEGSIEALAGALSQPSRPDDPARLATDPSSAYETALKTPDSQPVSGIVLLTDGRFNAAASDTAQRLDRLRARDIPVYPILIGSSQPLTDVAIASVKSPDSVYLGDQANIDVTIKADGVPAGSPLTVTLKMPNGPNISKSVNVPADGGRPVASFRVPTDKAGVIPIGVEVATVPGDARPDNNQRTLSLQIVDDKASVLIVDGEPRWEFRYLRNALTRDPRVKLEAVLLKQPTPVGSIEASYPTALPPAPASSETPDPINRFDVILLGDLSPSEATTAVWERVARFVGERGGTLVLIPGPRGWPGIITSHEMARALVPITEPHLVKPEAGDDPLHASLPPGAKIVPAPIPLADPATWPMLQLASDTVASQNTWSGLPRLPWTLAGTPKPAATVLLAASDGSAVAVAMPYGLGKVLYLGTDCTWRWRHGVGDLYHHRFWGQVVRWGSAQGLTSGDRYVRFGPVKPRIGDGEHSLIRARVSEMVPNIGAGSLIAARVFKTGGSSTDAIAVVPLRASAGQPRTFEGYTPSLPEGAYQIRLDAPGIPTESPGKPLEASLTVTSRDTPERVELTATRDPLERVATATGGKVFDTKTAAELPRLLKSRIKSESKIEETPLWDHPAGLCLFFGVLTCEWILRRRVGLP